MLRIEMLPAAHGDCLWIEYGSESKTRHILIDAGTPGTYTRLEKKMKEQFKSSTPHFDLFVITHIDADHIGGAVKLLERSEELGVTFGDVWFNGWDHIIEKSDVLGARQAEIVTEALKAKKLPWNEAFDGCAVVIDKKLPEKEVGEGIKLTLLSPWREQLHALIPKWKKELREAGLMDAQGNRLRPSDVLGGHEPATPADQSGTKISIADLVAEPFDSDTAEANGSSIAFLLEYGKRRCIFTGDAHVPVLLKSLAILEQSGPVQADVLKLSHHGSKANVSAELLEKLDCRRHLVSTSGATFGHPDRESIARIIRHGGERPEICFNYESDFNRCWNNAKLMQSETYRAQFPTGETGGFVVEL